MHPDSVHGSFKMPKSGVSPPRKHKLTGESSLSLGKKGINFSNQKSPGSDHGEEDPEEAEERKKAIKLKRLAAFARNKKIIADQSNTLKEAEIKAAVVKHSKSITDKRQKEAPFRINLHPKLTEALSKYQQVRPGRQVPPISVVNVQKEESKIDYRWASTPKVRTSEASVRDEQKNKSTFFNSKRRNSMNETAIT